MTFYAELELSNILIVHRNRLLLDCYINYTYSFMESHHVELDFYIVYSSCHLGLGL